MSEARWNCLSVSTESSWPRRESGCQAHLLPLMSTIERQVVGKDTCPCSPPGPNTCANSPIWAFFAGVARERILADGDALADLGDVGERLVHLRLGAAGLGAFELVGDLRDHPRERLRQARDGAAQIDDLQAQLLVGRTGLRGIVGGDQQVLADIVEIAQQLVDRPAAGLALDPVVIRLEIGLDVRARDWWRWRPIPVLTSPALTCDFFSAILMPMRASPLVWLGAAPWQRRGRPAARRGRVGAVGLRAPRAPASARSRP